MNNEFKRMKQLAGIKEINLMPSIKFSNIPDVAEYAEKNLKFKQELLDTVYKDAGITSDDNWDSIKSNFLENPIEAPYGGDFIYFLSDEDAILLAFKKLEDLTDEGSFNFGGNTFYYGFN